MKKTTYLFVISAAIFALSLGAGAVFGKGYGMAGCGLGSIVMGPKNGQILAVTTNGTAGNQTFGITSGTSNCRQDSAAFKKRQQEIFVHANIDNLEHQMAAGKGEQLTALAGLMGCPVSKAAAFGEMTKTNYAKLAKYANNPSKLLAVVKKGVAGDKKLAQSCRVI